MEKYRSTGDIRQDASEGIRTTMVAGPGELSREQAKERLRVDAPFKLYAGGTLRHNLSLPTGFLLSTSTEFRQDLLQRFDCDDFFVIDNPTLFNDAIRRAILETLPVGPILCGRVAYVVDKTRHINVTEFIEMRSAIERTELRDYFLKVKDEYAAEAEYRFVYLVESEKPLEPLFLKLTREEIRASCSFPHAAGEKGP